jgi:hypothetical protein
MKRLYFFIVCLLASGCGTGRDIPATHQVEATVNINGKPLVDGLVTFSPVEPNLPSATGKVSNGLVQGLKTAGESTGVVAGEHIVTIYDDTMVPGAKNLVPDRYSGRDGGLVASVKSGEKNKFVFDLVAKPSDQLNKTFSP